MVTYISVLRRHKSKQSIHSHLTANGPVSVNSSSLQLLEGIAALQDLQCVDLRIVKWIAVLSTFYFHMEVHDH